MSCGCTDECTCVVQGDGTNIEVVGSGSVGDPYIVNLLENLAPVVLDSDTIDFDVTGSNEITGDVIPDPAGGLANNVNGVAIVPDPASQNATVSVSASGLRVDVPAAPAAVDAPPGTLAFGLYSDVNVPAGYLLCDGNATYDPGIYPDLFAIVGTQFGGDGVLTFGVPDLRGYVLAGPDVLLGSQAFRMSNIPNLYDTYGLATHILSLTEMPAHQHTGTTDAAGDHFHFPSNFAGFTTGPKQTNQTFAVGAQDFVGQSAAPGGTTSTDGNHQHTFTTSVAGVGNAHNNVQPTFAATPVVKT